MAFFRFLLRVARSLDLSFDPALGGEELCVPARGTLLLNHFDGVAAADSPRLEHAAENAAPPAQSFLEPLANLVHLPARRARNCDLEQHFPGAEPLPFGESAQADAARGDVFFHPAGRNSEFLQRLEIHQQDLTLFSGASVDATLEASVL